MAKIPRKRQKIFGSGLAAPTNVAVIGSLAAGAPAYSLDLDVLQSLAGYLLGFNGIVLGNNSPAKEDLNGLMLVAFQQLAYILQAGVAEWDPTTTYYVGDLVRIPGTPAIFASLLDANTNNNPATDTNNWSGSAGSYPGAANTGGAQSLAVNGVGHKVLLNTAYINPNGAWVNANSNYIAPVVGNYDVTAMLQVDNNTGTAATMELSLRAVKNGVTVLLAGGESVASPPGGRWYPKIAGMVSLAAGDTLEIQLSATDGVNTGAVTVSNSNCSVARRP